jgi:3-hydroxybutyryl-CoA dehydratase
MTKLKVGDKAQIVKTFTPEEVKSFAILSGDTNPIHTDNKYASKTYFGQTIVQGTLVASLF